MKKPTTWRPEDHRRQHRRPAPSPRRQRCADPCPAGHLARPYSVARANATELHQGSSASSASTQASAKSSAASRGGGVEVLERVGRLARARRDAVGVERADPGRREPPPARRGGRARAAAAARARRRPAPAARSHAARSCGWVGGVGGRAGAARAELEHDDARAVEPLAAQVRAHGGRPALAGAVEQQRGGEARRAGCGSARRAARPRRPTPPRCRPPAARRGRRRCRRPPRARPAARRVGTNCSEPEPQPLERRAAAARRTPPRPAARARPTPAARAPGRRAPAQPRGQPPRAVARDEPAARRVVAGADQQRDAAPSSRHRQHVLGRAPREQPAQRAAAPARLERERERGDRGDDRRRQRRGEREHARHDAERRVQRQRERPLRAHPVRLHPRLVPGGAQLVVQPRPPRAARRRCTAPRASKRARPSAMAATSVTGSGRSSHAR